MEHYRQIKYLKESNKQSSLYITFGQHGFIIFKIVENKSKIKIGFGYLKF